MRQADLLADDGRLADAAQKFHELGRVDDRVGNAAVADQLFLGLLGEEIRADRHFFGTDDRQRDVMADARGLFRRSEILTGGREEIDRRFVEGRRVGEIDNDLGAGERFGKPSPVSVLTPVLGAAATA